LAGWPETVGKLLLEKMTHRRNEIVLAFGFEGQEINGKKVKLWPQVDSKTFSWGDYIREGKLTKDYYEEGHPIDYHKIEYEPKQIISLAKFLVPAIFSATKNIPYYEMIRFPQEISRFAFEEVVPGLGIGFRLNREIRANRNATDENKAWITHDTLEIFGNIGVTGVLPINSVLEGEIEGQILAGKQFNVSYFSPTPLKAIKGRVKLLAELPFKRHKIIENLESGESYAEGFFIKSEFSQGVETSGSKISGF
jgi:hypothetical protein